MTKTMKKAVYPPDQQCLVDMLNEIKNEELVLYFSFIRAVLANPSVDPHSALASMCVFHNILHEMIARPPEYVVLESRITELRAAGEDLAPLLREVAISIYEADHATDPMEMVTDWGQAQ